MVGGFAGVVVVPPDLPEPAEPDDVPEEVLEPPCFGPSVSNGSFVSKRENDCSCPVSAEGWTAATSWVVDVAAGVVVVPEAVTSGVVPASVGAASVDGVVVGVDVVSAGVVSAATACGFAPPPPFRLIIVFAAYAAARARTQTSAIAIFFCFAAFAFAASATVFFAICFSSRAD